MALDRDQVFEAEVAGEALFREVGKRMSESRKSGDQIYLELAEEGHLLASALAAKLCAMGIYNKKGVLASQAEVQAYFSENGVTLNENIIKSIGWGLEAAEDIITGKNINDSPVWNDDIKPITDIQFEG